MRWLVVLVPTLAWADEPLAVRALVDGDGEPRLTLDAIPRPTIVGLGVTEENYGSVLRLGRVRLIGGSSAWTAYQDLASRDAAEETVVARGWTAGVGASVDLGWLTLDVGVREGELVSQYGSGRYREASIGLRTRALKLSRWTSVWLSLGVGRRQWQTPPPSGEADATTFMLSIGGTFR